MHLTMQAIGWSLDYKRFRIYLKEKFHVTTANYFIGYIQWNKKLYMNLESYGYTMIYRPTHPIRGEGYKGNCDVELVLNTMINIDNFDKAVLVTSDGDFSSLVTYLIDKDKLERVLVPNKEHCSRLLRKAAGSKIDYIENLRVKLELEGREAPRED